MKYTTLLISPLDLILDYENPRFIVPPNPSQDEIRSYLLEYEEVEDLAKGINDFGGLMFGERVIVCKENGRYIVLEGNRRVCSCQLLLNPELIPDNKKQRFPAIKPDTLLNISEIEVDIAPDRLTAQSSLASKHIDGIKRWSTLSKQKFYANSFDAGKDLEFIADTTGTSKSKVKNGIIDYKLLNYAFNLDMWTNEEKNTYLNLQTLQPTPYLRVFTTKSEIFNMSTKNLLKLTANPKTLEPVTQVPKSLFNEAIYLIAKAAFINEEFNTRNKVDDVPRLIDLLKSYYLLEEETSASQDETTEPPNNPPNADNKSMGQENKGEGNSSSEKDSKEDDKEKSSNPESEKRTDKTDKPPTFKGAAFFEDLNWKTVDTKNPENHGLLFIAQEIVNISKNNNYKKLCISATILMRSLLEQTLSYHIKKVGLYDKLTKGSNGKTPALERIIAYYLNNLDKVLPNNMNIQRCFRSFAENKGLKDTMDMMIHNPHLVYVKGDILDNFANCGFKAYINFILNN